MRRLEAVEVRPMVLKQIQYAHGLTAHAAFASQGLPPRPPVLLVHGLMAGAWQFEHLQSWLAARGYTSYALNLRGHHGSRPVAKLGAVSVWRYIEDAAFVARELGQPIVIGQSMGGLIAQKLAESGLAKAVVLVCSLPPRGIAWRTHQGWIGGGLWHAFMRLAADLIWPTAARRHQLVLHDWPLCKEAAGSWAASMSNGLARPHRLELRDWIFNRMSLEQAAELLSRQTVESGRAIRQLALGAVKVDAAKVRCPVLSIITGQDRLVRPDVGWAIARRYGSNVCCYPDRGHYALVAEDGWVDIAMDMASWLEALV